ncbi:DNA cross-link repair protein PSO2/SNM1 [Friedmanniomyces endolithicus]|uniref:DNA cross-link repair protein PSO2/SNM1 n=1 Tax=Friedmanniomyces endolithicus TaxID=329885 RepID=A0A4U0TR27_9PEZI|nr:DNA cross-link repair protein PSO2/SNM1 [Friedmanniomyces endolithicus]KAK0306824.1 DNA cross-link repair protein PSO2/SNM1 [Friedmanniomyces endolithicus]KAK0322827.1 DNA cross-link repair protein PSO2/SNM1 [Friedmanniomyces endolithicus]KAK0834009.1 DNA cross-link repair protein PSO2/SNM1 [Friedmanniomyces endolithicus]KAK0963445.1 DNA cross-link repair protein PSO2/SNM1 [Friedmanniomyces endolithicus]
MFRKPREPVAETPSLGRPPTPPDTPAKTPFTLAIPPSVPAPRMAIKAKAAKQAPLPTIGRQGAVGSAKKATATAAKIRQSGKANSSILSFFKKTDGPEGAGLFVQECGGRAYGVQDVENRSPSPEGEGVGEEGVEDEARFNESGGSVKRRRTSGGLGDGRPFGEAEATLALQRPKEPARVSSRAKAGPFVEESDSEEDGEQPEASIAIKDEAGATMTEPVLEERTIAEVPADDPDPSGVTSVLAETPTRPPLIKQETSHAPDADDVKDFDEMDDFDEDLFEQGDEFLERRYMEEQAALEGEDDEQADGPLTNEEPLLIKQEEPPDSLADADGSSSCPICNVGLVGVSDQDAGMHVNNCLDGNPTPLPERQRVKAHWPITGQSAKTENMTSANQYKKPNRAPKPGQADPFELGKADPSGSAFNKLMSGHAEDAAWAEAAATEHASRGKPAYQRTCPFYKILPGLSICVDAFRYGAVQGCQAYFLSHFHSDHYIGLTASWSHGPIYCSKVTGNLVRQQLRVDPKYVVDLEFDKTVDVPGTKGVKVTMIHANHCPGSSLYLFETVIGKKTNGEPRLQRILHCGDFRACRAHVEHPLLMPDVQDRLTGKTREQKIDVCYLDTTYLNPKYAFPNQHDVITACADMCVSLSKHSVDESDGWEQMKRQRAGEGMVKFVRKESASSIKDEPVEDEDNKDNIKLLANPAASQQVLSTNTTPSFQKGRGRLLVVVGTYSIGKERICIGIAHALGSKIYAPPNKMRIVSALEDPELNALMTPDPRAAQVHMTPLFEIRADTLDDYLKDYFPHFTRAVGFRPSGWNYRPPTSRFLESPSVSTVLNGENWKSAYAMKDLVPQRGSTSRASCFGVPYSEHSSFRELTMFCCALRIERVIPTVNVGSAKGRERMKGWCERWAVERRKSGVWRLPEDGSW